jgi:hypothetical protein
LRHLARGAVTRKFDFRKGFAANSEISAQARKLQTLARIMASFDSLSRVIEVKLDGSVVELPAERRSFAAIRSYLESLALKQQRILCSLSVDGEPAALIEPRRSSKPFSVVEGETMSLSEVPAQLIGAALEQTGKARAQVQSAVELVLINSNDRAREIWWDIATALKEPLLTLTLLPDKACPTPAGSASIAQLRRWQLEQLGGIIQDVDDSCDAEDTMLLSDTLEKRALPWLDKLHDSLKLWLETVLLSNPQPLS